MCSFLEKFERILKKIVKVLARPASAGLATPARRPHPPMRGHGTAKLIIYRLFTFFE